MIIKVGICGYSDFDYIYIPNNINLEKSKIRENFFYWIDNTKEEHPFWEYENGIRIGVDYRGDALVYWLNNYILNTSIDKSNLIESFSNKNLDYDLIIEL